VLEELGQQQKKPSQFSSSVPIKETKESQAQKTLFYDATQTLWRSDSEGEKDSSNDGHDGKEEEEEEKGVSLQDLAASTTPAGAEVSDRGERLAATDSAHGKGWVGRSNVLLSVTPSIFRSIHSVHLPSCRGRE